MSNPEPSKPCPFCGCEAHYFYWKGKGTHRLVTCAGSEEKECGASMHGDSKKEAIKAWNTRSTQPEEGK